MAKTGKRGAKAAARPTSGRKASAAAATEPLVVYIHGIGRHEPAAALKTAWDIALFGSDRGPATRMAYWADIVHPAAANASTTKSRRRPRPPDGDLATAALRAAGVRAPEARIYAESLLTRLGADDVSGRRLGKKVLPLPGFLRRPISRIVLQTFVGDSAAYFFDDRKRRAIRARFRAAVADETRPLVVVAHSQGSVVALEVLAELGDALPSVKLVTIGSPLGLREVQDFLDVPPHEPPFQVPASVEEWHNFADPLDPVALDKTLRGEFEKAGDDGSAGPFVTDQLIVNDRTRRLVGFNPHSAVGYLAHPKVRRCVHGAAQHDSMARFVVARDVAEGLAVEGRDPVMIELLEPGYWALGESQAQLHEREQRERQTHGDAITLAGRVQRATADLASLVRKVAREQRRDPDEAVAAARIDPLRRFVAARLTPDEVRLLATDHRDFNVYAVWKSSTKKALIRRSPAVLQVDAAREAYDARGKDVVWAVLDTGVRADHAHFRAHGTIKAVWDCTRQGAPVLLPNDKDKDGHGSHVAGIIAGQGELPGVAPLAQLVVYKVLEKGEGEDAWIIKALDHIATQNENASTQAIHGINLSLGGPYDATVYGCGFTPLCQELRRQWRSGVLVVVACGNEGQLDVQTGDGEVEINTPMSIGDPANLEDCIAVGSVNADRPHLYGVSPFSSRGPTSDGRVKPDVVAPGERITSVNARSPDGYRVESGTSMAAPHVSGLLAAFLSARREFRGRPDEVKRILLDACTDLGRDRYHQGRGLPNLMKMLLSV